MGFKMGNGLSTCTANQRHVPSCSLIGASLITAMFVAFHSWALARLVINVVNVTVLILHCVPLTEQTIGYVESIS